MTWAHVSQLSVIVSNIISFLLFEAYLTEEAATAHKKTAHSLQWREAVEPWMAEPRTADKDRILFSGSRFTGA